MDLDFLGFGKALAVHMLNDLKNNPEKMQKLATHLIDELIERLEKHAEAKS